MSEFKTIETQEQFDAAIGERIKRERKTIESQYEGYLSPGEVEKKYEGYLSPDEVEERYKEYLSPEEAAKKDAKIRGYETDSVKTRVAMETGLPYAMARRLSGDTEEAIRADAQSLLDAMGPKREAPLATGEVRDNGSGPDRSAFRTLAAEL